MSCRAAEGHGGSCRGTTAATSTAARAGCCRRRRGRNISGATPTGPEMDQTPPTTASASTCGAPTVAAAAAVAVAGGGGRWGRRGASPAGATLSSSTHADDAQVLGGA